jgi:hypothetical protein
MLLTIGFWLFIGAICAFTVFIVVVIIDTLAFKPARDEKYRIEWNLRQDMRDREMEAEKAAIMARDRGEKLSAEYDEIFQAIELMEELERENGKRKGLRSN